MKKERITKTELFISRRNLLRVFGWGSISGLVMGACSAKSLGHQLVDIMDAADDDGPQKNDTKASQEGRLLSRPSKRPQEAVAAAAPTPGLLSLPIDKNREAFLFVPGGYRLEKPAPFALMLHGAGGSPQRAIGLLRDLADEAGILLLAAKSKQPTWDVIIGSYGPDVEFIDRALAYTFERFAVDKSRLAVSGFSDGASYALSLGIINGKLFSHVLAFSPGFMVPTGQSGKPRFFISHGTQDHVLPIESCSRKLVPELKQAGYDVVYKEFEGPHAIPPEIARQAVGWFTSQSK